MSFSFSLSTVVQSKKTLNHLVIRHSFGAIVGDDSISTVSDKTDLELTCHE